VSQLIVGPLHNGQFCSTWGNHHFKTFDGDFFQFPFACNYVLTSHCRSAYEDFNIQLSRQQVDGVASIKRVMMRLDGVLVELANTSLTVNDKQITIPFSQYGLSIQRKGSYVRIEAKLGLVVMWNENDTLWVEMDEKYMNQTCGLCGDYNGVQLYNEFISHGVVKDTLNYGTSWKVDAPTETCMESHQEPTACTNRCMELLSEPAFLSCQDLLNMDAFVEACEKDLCHCGNGSTCLCPTMAEFSRQCAHAGGTPLPWKTAELCANECPFNLEYMECGNTCRATCTQPESSQPCEEHCESGCFCPAGMVFDDVTQSGCVALQQCYCQHNGKAYRPGESFSGPCRTCTCTLGKWSCQEHECPATCSFLGGSHITTYDDKSYTFHGECTFVLSKDINGSYIVLGDIAKLSQTDTESLMAVTLLYGAKRVSYSPSKQYRQKYKYTNHHLTVCISDNITVFRPSTFFVVVHAVDGLQLEIQIVPTMQLYIKVDVSYKGQLRGLCGDFNDVEADDFKTTNGMIAGTAATYANTWRAQPSCPDVTNRISNPCSLSVDKERYSNYWCALLSDANGIFAPCHSEIDPSVYEVACLHDTCLCERSEDCMCAALSSYVHACRAVGVSLKGWRNNTCTKYSSSCPEGLVYSYRLTGCQPSCLGLSQPHASCQVAFSPMDGCGCAPGTYLNEEGRCVPASQCCCYEGDVVIPCTAPMVFFNCSGLQQGARGSECQKSCRSEDSECISDRCVSGCMCPEGSLTDGAGGCVKEDLCPCLYNSVSYTPGQTVKVDCNTCECRARKWECTTHECDGICTIYGDGHYISFDEKKFSFNGDCGYTFAQDYCHGEMSNGTFRVVTENIPCASIDSTCSMAIKLYLGNTEILLSDEKIKVIKQSHEAEIPYQVHSIGIYLVIEAKNGLILIWNKKTTLMIKLNPSYKGQLCGLCGNYDGSVKNDFTTRNHEVVAEAVQFGNSWKVSPTCPDVDAIKRPCQLYSHRQAWALKHCSIIDSEVFAACHSQVDPTNYYDACVKDTCACNSGGDCECFCSAVEAYAAACNRAGACVRWRTPSICPLFCDFYNPIGECEWHYEPCGDTCLKTCKNPTATCSSQIPAMEGCYPRCPPDQPYLEERTMKCVSNQQCGCYDNNDKHYEEGDTMPSEGNLKNKCIFFAACICIYNGNKYHYGATIYSTHDGDGACFTAVCEEGGHINRTLTICPFTTPTPTTTTQEPTTTIFTFSTSVAKSDSFSGVITFTTTVPPTYSTLTTIEQSSTTTTTAQSTTITTTEQPTTTREHPSTTTTTEQPTTATTTTEQPTTPTTTEQSTTASTTAQPHVSTRTSQGPTTIPTTTEQSTTPTTTEQSTTLTTTEQSTTQVKTTTTSLTTTPHGCLVCKWTAWNNNHYPDYNGENETIESIPQIDLSRCNSSLEIQCRASEYKDVSLEALGQRVTCDTTVGLVCQSKDQIPPRCHDYEIRVKCCDQCEQSTTTATTEQPTTPTTTEQSTTPTTTTEQSTPPTTTEQSTTPTTTEQSTTPTTTEQSTTTTTTTEQSTTPTTTEQSTTPTTTTEQSTTTKTTTILPTTPRSTEQSTTPTTTTEQSTTPTTTEQSTTPTITEQSTTTTTTTEQSTTPTTTEQSTTPTTTEQSTTPTTTTEQSTTTTTTTEQSTIQTTTEQSTTTTTTEQPTTPTTTEQPTTTTTSESVVTRPESTTTFFSISTQGLQDKTTTTSLTTTPHGCLVCKWTAWNNNHYPDYNGENETIESIPQIDLSRCNSSLEIQCRASEYKDVSLEALGQRVTCDTTVGLVCQSKDQIPPRCHDYEIRVKCCDQCEQSTTTATTEQPTTPRTTEQSTTPTTTTEQSTPPTTTEQSTEQSTTPTTTEQSTTTTTTTEQSTTQTTTEQSTTPTITEQSTTTTTTTEQSTTPTTTEQSTTPTTTEQSTTPTTTTEQSTTTTTTTILPTTPTTTEQSTTPTTTKQSTTTTTTTEQSTIQTTTEQSTTTTTTTEHTQGLQDKTTTTSLTTTPHGCLVCKWTAWNNNHYPDYNGENETIESIPQIDLSRCNSSLEIQCRASEYKDVSLEALGQRVTCDTTVGLVCQSKDQIPPRCHDYEIRVKCCDQCEQSTTTATTEQPTTPRTTEQSTTPTTTTEQSTPPTTTEQSTTPTTTEQSTTPTTTEQSTTPTTTEQSTTTTTTTEQSTTPTTTEQSTTPTTTTEQSTTTKTTTILPTTPRTTEQSTTPTTTEQSTTTTTTTEQSTTPTTTEQSTTTTTTTEQSTTPTTTEQSTTTATTEQPTTPTTTQQSTTPTTTTEQSTPPTTTEHSTTPTTTEQSTTTTTTEQSTTPTTTTEQPTTITTTTEQSTTPTTTEQSTTLTTTEQSTTQVETTTTSLTTTPHGCLVCNWTAWNNNHYPDYNGEYETIESIPQIDLSRCNSSLEIQCRASEYKDVSLEALGQRVTCDTTVGLVCQSKDQIPPRCHDYEIRVKCCDQCEQSTTTATTEQPTTPRTTEQSTTPTTTTEQSTPPTTTEQSTTPTTTEQSTTPTTTEQSTTPTTTEQSTTTTTTTEQSTTPTTTEQSTTPTTTTEQSTTTKTTTILPTTPRTTEQSTTPTTTEQSTTTTTTTEQSTTPTTTEQSTTTTTTTEQSTTPTTTEQSTTTATTEQPTTPTTTQQSTTPTTTTEQSTPPTTTENSTTPTTTEQSTTTTTTEQSTTPTTTTEQPTTITTTTEQSTTPTTTEQSTTLTTTEQSTTQVETTTTSLTTTPHGCLVCNWTAWNNNHYPDYNGEYETIESIPQIDLSRCNSSLEIQCRASEYKDVSLEALGQRVTCDTTVGLVCQSKDQIPPRCHDYEIRVKCCDQCEQSTTTATTEQPTTPRTTEQSTTPTTTTEQSTPPTTTEQSTTPTTTEQSTTPTTTEQSTTPTTTEQSTTTTTTTEQSTTPTTTEQSTTPTTTTEQSTTTKTTTILPTTPRTTEQSTTPTTTEQSTTTTTTTEQSTTPTTTEQSTTTTTTTEQSTTPTTTEQSTTTATTEQPTTPTTTQQSTTPTTTTEQSTPPTTTEHSTTPTTTEQSTTTTTTEQSTTPTTTTEQPTTITTTTEQSTTPTTTEQSTTLTTTEQSTTQVETTTTSLTTTPHGCLVCNWTAWNNNHYPDYNGEYETIESIPQIDLSRCNSSLEIQCRASEYKDVSLEALGQRVTCDTTVGLVCQSKDQIPPRCHDYEIRVKCCDQCEQSTTTATTEQPTTPTTPEQSTTPTTTTEQSTPPTTTEQSTTPTTTEQSTTTTTTTEQSTTPTTTEHGWCFTSFCNVTCHVEKHATLCISTTPPPPPPTTTSPPPSTTTSQSTTEENSSFTTPPPKNCDFLTPPRKHGESWRSEKNCYTDTCQIGQIQRVHVDCPPAVRPVCVNGYQPKKIYDHSGCCFQYHCKCECLGWGDPHYITFDGKYYSFQENCTYVLVKEIVPRHNFTIVVDNENCGTNTRMATCTHSMTVFYKTYEIVLTQERSQKTVHLNGRQVFPPFSNNDFEIRSTVIQMTVKIPEIEAIVWFKGLSFYVDLPYSHFHNNTEGQCGTCDNDQTNDCRLRNGETHPSCYEMAADWEIEVNNKPYCNVPPTLNLTTPTPTPTLSTTTNNCPSVQLCEIIKSSIFEECHKILSPNPFYLACQYDGCHTTVEGGCASLEMYAELCASEMVCIDWRPSTSGMCEYPCSGNKVYNACGPAIFRTCDSSLVDPSCNIPTEGCFCPEGTTHYGTNSEENNAFVHTCTCCQEVSTITKQVEVTCSDGQKKTKSYVSIDKCGCNETQCL
uniref:Uncharacterized protein n=1 Tax=Gadus morhua TaxID=8049 RepID=A0A8C4ZV03_GADMO